VSGQICTKLKPALFETVGLQVDNVDGICSPRAHNPFLSYDPNPLLTRYAILDSKYKDFQTGYKDSNFMGQNFKLDFLKIWKSFSL